MLLYPQVDVFLFVAGRTESAVAPACFLVVNIFCLHQLKVGGDFDEDGLGNLVASVERLGSIAGVVKVDKDFSCIPSVNHAGSHKEATLGSDA